MVSQASTAPGMVTACAEVSGTELILCSRYHSQVAAIGARPRAVIGDDLALAFRLHQREAVATDAGRLRLDHAEQCAQRRPPHPPPCRPPHHLDRRQRRERVRGRDHRVLGVDRRPAGEMEIPHAKLLALLLFRGVRRDWTLHGTFVRLLRQWLACQPTSALLPRQGGVGFRLARRRLINPRHVLQSRRILSICRPARFPGTARAAARDLCRPPVERQRAAGAGGHQRHPCRSIRSD